MDIAGISASSASTQSVGALPQQELDKDAFMSLLVAQLQNQDPTNPQSNEDMIAQLAEFSSLEQMTQLNESFLGLAVLQQSNALMAQLTDSSALIGQQVSYVDPSTGEQLNGSVESVKIEEGLAILNIDGNDVPLLNVTEITGGADLTDVLTEDSETATEEA